MEAHDHDANENGPDISVGAASSLASNLTDLWKRQQTNDSTTLSNNQYQLVEASGIRYAIADEQPPRTGFVRAFVTRTYRPTHCTGQGRCSTLENSCPYCFNQLQLDAARQFRRAWCAA